MGIINSKLSTKKIGEPISLSNHNYNSIWWFGEPLPKAPSIQVLEYPGDFEIYLTESQKKIWDKMQDDEVVYLSFANGLEDYGTEIQLNNCTNLNIITKGDISFVSVFKDAVED